MSTLQHTRLIKSFLQKEKLTHGQWLAKLEEVRTWLNPHLDKFTLPKFGEFACMPGRDGFYDQISRHNPKEYAASYFLKDHGIAYFDDSGERLTQRGETRAIEAWGLSKDGKWVVITVIVELISAEAGHPDWEHAQSVRIDSVSLCEMLRLSHMPPLRVLSQIVSTIEDWERKRRGLYEEAHNLAEEARLLQNLLLHNFI